MGGTFDDASTRDGLQAWRISIRGSGAEGSETRLSGPALRTAWCCHLCAIICIVFAQQAQQLSLTTAAAAARTCGQQKPTLLTVGATSVLLPGRDRASV